MLVSVNLWTAAIPANNSGYIYNIPESNISGPIRTDIQVGFAGCFFDSSKNQYQIFIQLSPLGANKTTLQTNGGQTPITTDPKGFSLRTGWPGYTATTAVFQMIFDAADNFPEFVQAQLGAKGGGTTPNSGYKFAKAKVVPLEAK